MSGAEDTVLGSSVSQDGALGSYETTVYGLLMCVFRMAMAGAVFLFCPLPPAWLLLT